LAFVRRIREQDCSQDFSTGKRTFDFGPDGKRLGLRFYFERNRSGRYESYVLVEKRKVHGVLCIQKCDGGLYVSRVGVREGLWRKGYGTQLMRFAVLKTIEYKCARLFLEADWENVEFYEKMGFSVVRKYFDDYWGSSATMELRLSV